MELNESLSLDGATYNNNNGCVIDALINFQLSLNPILTGVIAIASPLLLYYQL